MITLWMVAYEWDYENVGPESVRVFSTRENACAYLRKKPKSSEEGGDWILQPIALDSEADAGDTLYVALKDIA